MFWFETESIKYTKIQIHTLLLKKKRAALKNIYPILINGYLVALSSYKIIIFFKKKAIKIPEVEMKVFLDCYPKQVYTQIVCVIAMEELTGSEYYAQFKTFLDVDT